MVSDYGQYCAVGEWCRLELEPCHASCPHDNLHLTGKNDQVGAGKEGGSRIERPGSLVCSETRGRGRGRVGRKVGMVKLT